MSQSNMTGPTRRALLTGAASACLAGLPRTAAAGDFKLTAAPARVPLVAGQPETAVWAYNGAVPGPEIRLRQGERARIAVENRLAEDTTVHFHGIRLPNAMDGVPHLTQPPIAPGGTFTYEFGVPDAGTYWYHPHVNSAVQLGRGLSGPFIVEEREPLPVDRDVVWMLSDWRLLADAQIRDDFGNMHDKAHNGRVGDIVTINGRVPDAFHVRRGERIRLRLINAANARVFGLKFAGHRPMIIAYDGQPVTPHAPPEGAVVLGPAMRIDLILDMAGQSGRAVRDQGRLLPRPCIQAGGHRLRRRSLRERPPDGPIALPANTMPEPDVVSASATR